MGCKKTAIARNKFLNTLKPLYIPKGVVNRVETSQIWHQHFDGKTDNHLTGQQLPKVLIFELLFKSKQAQNLRFQCKEVAAIHSNFNTSGPYRRNKTLALTVGRAWERETLHFTLDLIRLNIVHWKCLASLACFLL